mmetsp:Transcript_6970/g.14563  ORF Transcript_6970/g.14563 Transcript_6970/m.14563 type:complete len:364 (+) Transcript_6970:370-1461(+)
MFGGNIVGDGDAMINTIALDGKALFQGFTGRGAIGFGEGVNLAFDLLVNFFNQCGRGTQQNGTGDNIVFGLGNQIGRHHLGIGGFVANDQNFRWSRQHVNATISTDNGFGRRDPFISRSTNHVATGHVVSVNSISHGGNGLRATDAQKVIRSGNVTSCQGNGSGFGTGQNHCFASGGSCRDGRHNDGGRQGIASSRGVTARSFAGTHSVTRLASGDIHFHVRDTLALHFGKGLDALVNVDQGGSFLIRQTIKGGFAFFLRDSETGSIGGNISQSLANFQEFVLVDFAIGLFQFVDNGGGLFQRFGVHWIFNLQRHLVGRDAVQNTRIRSHFSCSCRCNEWDVDGKRCYGLNNRYNDGQLMNEQ